MTNFVLTDANGAKHTVSEQQLQALAANGRITPDTPLETDTGHSGLAGQIPGLQFKAAAMPPFRQTSQAAPQTGETYSKKDGIAWFDFTFRDVRLHKAIRRVCFGIYLCAWIFGILLGLWGTGLFLQDTASPGDALVALPSTIPLWGGIILFIFLVRIVCEWQIVLMDYINKRSRRE